MRPFIKKPRSQKASLPNPSYIEPLSTTTPTNSTINMKKAASGTSSQQAILAQAILKVAIRNMIADLQNEEDEDAGYLADDEMENEYVELEREGDAKMREG